MRTYVIFQAPFDMKSSQQLIAVCTQLVQRGTKEIYLALSTPGGSVTAGLTAYSVLRALPASVLTHNIGNVDSIGNAVFLAGERRIACPHSTFMFHGVAFDMPAGARADERFLKERLAAIGADQRRTARNSG